MLLRISDYPIFLKARYLVTGTWLNREYVKNKIVENIKKYDLPYFSMFEYPEQVAKDFIVK